MKCANGAAPAASVAATGHVNNGAPSGQVNNGANGVISATAIATSSEAAATSVPMSTSTGIPRYVHHKITMVNIMQIIYFYSCTPPFSFLNFLEQKLS